MPRYATDLSPNRPADQALADVEAYLQAEGFARQQGSTWKKGLGLLTGPQLALVEARGDSIRLEAWIQFALFPGVYIGEMGIDGWFGAIPKKALKRRVHAIEELITGQPPA